MEIRLADQNFAADRELAQFSSGLDGEGAVVSFVGIARDRSTEGEKVEQLILEAHPRLTLRSMEKIG
ncbi:MAG TPA: molybdenum cofactor biosynthesis protein MoaE, partial [Allosphingosinicella sp.]|nr:molybdenum cofactor biosynthesis protein MoaE [Allosphingosinicella sp.]